MCRQHIFVKIGAAHCADFHYDIADKNVSKSCKSVLEALNVLLMMKKQKIKINIEDVMYMHHVKRRTCNGQHTRAPVLNRAVRVE